MSNHLGDTNKMVGNTPRMDASAHDDGAIWQTGCDIELKLNAANDRIKRLEKAGNKMHRYITVTRGLLPECTNDWREAKKAKL